MSDVIGTALSNAASTAALALVQQRFVTLPVANLGTALYVLSVRAPGLAALPIPALTFLFPLSPQALRKEPTEYNTIYDVQGSPQQNGVARMVDLWGETPPTYMIEGTTGFKLHSMDGFVYTGKAAFAKLQGLPTAFAQLNQQAMLNQSTDLYTMEFYDYWSDEYWQVVPVGPQTYQQRADRPIISTYLLRLVAIQPVSSPIPPLLVDLVENAFSIATEAATSEAETFLALKLSQYKL